MKTTEAIFAMNICKILIFCCRPALMIFELYDTLAQKKILPVFFQDYLTGISNRKFLVYNDPLVVLRPCHNRSLFYRFRYNERYLVFKIFFVYRNIDLFSTGIHAA